VALSGSGPTVIALATDNLQEIGETIGDHFKRNGLNATVRNLAVAPQGMRLTEKGASSK
jgi:homoserine kinase